MGMAPCGRAEDTLLPRKDISGGTPLDRVTGAVPYGVEILTGQSKADFLFQRYRLRHLLKVDREFPLGIQTY